jgi:hypothetical protein
VLDRARLAIARRRCGPDFSNPACSSTLRRYRDPTRLAESVCIGHDAGDDEAALQIERERVPAAIFEPREMLEGIRIELDPGERRQADLVVATEDQGHRAGRRRDPLEIRDEGAPDALFPRAASDDQRVELPDPRERVTAADPADDRAVGACDPDGAFPHAFVDRLPRLVDRGPCVGRDVTELFDEKPGTRRTLLGSLGIEVVDLHACS